MNHMQTACCLLLASAFVLAGMLLSRIQGAMFHEQAQAEMVINRQNFTLMTTHTRDNDESVFVLDNRSNRLLVYSLNLTRNQLELVASEDLAVQFEFGQSAPGAPTPGRTPGSRTPR